MNDNSLTGTIPDGFDQWSSLEFADFQDNQFTGSLPSTVFDIPTIESMYGAFDVDAMAATAGYTNSNFPFSHQFYTFKTMSWMDRSPPILETLLFFEVRIPSVGPWLSASCRSLTPCFVVSFRSLSQWKQFVWYCP